MRDFRRRPAVIPVLLISILVVASACTADRADTDARVPSTTFSATTVVDTVPTTSTTGAGPSTTSTTSSVPTTTTTTRPELAEATYDSVARYHWIRHWSSYTARGLSRWENSVPEIQSLTLTSSADGMEQGALWLPPTGDEEKPLLVILHSWSSNYLQHAGIPYALWARENGWAVIAPDFRGRNDDVEAIGSELAVQDVIDAIDFGIAQEGVDESRVFAVGYSGGGMMGLLLAGRHPDRVTAVAAWGAVYDLVGFHRQSRSAGRHYYWEIEAACGGDPRQSDSEAYAECERRSPMTYLDAAREAGVPVYLGHGLWDSILSPRQSAAAFNQLADPEHRFTDTQLDQIARWQIPDDIPEELHVESYFGEGDPEVFLSVKSASVQLVYFRSNHDMVYQATMRWFASDPS